MGGGGEGDEGGLGGREEGRGLFKKKIEKKIEVVMRFKMLLNQELTFACLESATRGFVYRSFLHVSGEMLCPTHPPSSPVTQGWQKRHVTQMT